MLAERLKVPRALQTHSLETTAAGHVVAAPVRMKTGAHLRLMTTPPSDQDERDTLPPSPETEPPPELSLLPSDTLKQLDGYDESKFLHRALAVAADNAHLERERQKKAIDPEVLLKTSTDRIERLVAANYSLIHNELHTIAARTAATESGLEELRAELAAMRIRMTQIETALGLKTPATT